MNLFYNKEGIGDTLMVSFETINHYTMKFEKKEDVVRIFDEETNRTSGYNIFNASSYFDMANENGSVELNKEILERINGCIQTAGFTEKLTADLSPKFVVGYVVEKEKHPNADKLSVCKVNVGGETLQIVCGAPNVAAGQRVVVAKIGAVMPSGLVIKPSELRGVASSGMICSAKELNLPNAPQEKGILVLDENYQVGEKFHF